MKSGVAHRAHGTSIRVLKISVSALGEWKRSESVPCQFVLLEDDLCREPAMETLRQIPQAAYRYAIFSIARPDGDSNPRACVTPPITRSHAVYSPNLPIRLQSGVS